MTDLELLHFEQLKSKIQSRFLENHSPSEENISNWKGIDIIYFQEDLRKIAKGNISEKSFYTYFKVVPVTKIPRIDILNLLCIYVGYSSWYDFKKKNLFENEILLPAENPAIESNDTELPNLKTDNQTIESQNLDVTAPKESPKNTEVSTQSIENLPNNFFKIQSLKFQNFIHKNLSPNTINFIKKNFWLGIFVVLILSVLLLVFKDQFFEKKFTYRFIDADRNKIIEFPIEIKILKDNGESPIFYKLQPQKEFIYYTKSNSLKMEVNSTFYKEIEINRNLENAPSYETIELQPNDYAQMLYFYSTKKDKQVKLKKDRLNQLISNNALIYQIYDNLYYGVEVLTKQRYINLVTTPTTSLKNLEVIDTKMQNGKIVLIKFRIKTDETNQ